MNGQHDEVDVAMERLRARSWRVPGPDRVFQEKAMQRTDGRVVSFVRTHRVAAALGALVIAGAAVGGVVAAKSFRAKVVGPDGEARTMTLTPQADGTYRAVTADGATVIFAPSGETGGQVTVELDGAAAEKGAATIEVKKEETKSGG